MTRKKNKKGEATAHPQPVWAGWPDNKLLQQRMCELGIGIEGTRLQECTVGVCEELQHRTLRFRPYFWLSDEWFTPDGIPGVAVPFYLAHPRLAELEEKQMLEVEGGTTEWCMRLLRHEVGHAIDNAYRLHRKRKWQEVFGKYSQPYPDYYQPRPYSKRFVLHLDYWYAQSHPSEDFAETFAVWLTPGSQWHSRYQGWPALKKLKYVDELMARIAATPPAVRSRHQEGPLEQNRTTLAEYYQAKRRRYGVTYPDFYDRDLQRLFSVTPDRAESAAVFLRRIRPEVRRHVARWTGQYQYTIDQVLKQMIARCRELNLRVACSQEEAKLEATILLTVQTMNYLHGGHHRLAL